MYILISYDVTKLIANQNLTFDNGIGWVRDPIAQSVLEFGSLFPKLLHPQKDEIV